MKRLFLLISLVTAAVSVQATNYYVSAAGNDANAGTSAAAPWRTLAKVNSFTFAANDSILLRRGDVFFGAIVVNRNNLVFSAYGTGNRPVITGSVSVSGWTLASTGIYQAAVNAKSGLNMVVMNGRPQQIGRYPNASDANGGYLTYEAAGSTSITDNQMTAAVNWTGAELAIRKNGWVIDRCIITGHSTTVFNYRMNRNINTGNTPQNSPARVGYGYFIMDDVRTLDQLGEWYYDTTAKVLKMYFGTANPASYNVRVSVIDTLINVGSRTYITIDNINFEDANMSGVYSYLGGYVTVKNCEFTNMGAKGVHIFGSNDALVENVTVRNALSNAIQVVNRSKSNVVIRGCTVRNTGEIAGMGSYFDGSDYKGIYVVVQNNALIENNIVDSTGYSGIEYQGNDIIIQRNFVNHFCDVLHDGGGIYTFASGSDAAPGPTYTNRIVRNNICMNGIGAWLGTTATGPDVAGIFNDGRTMNVSILNNTVFNSAMDGIYCNNPAGMTIRGNVLYNNVRDIAFMKYSWGSISNLVIKRNISFNANSASRNMHYINGKITSPTMALLQADVQSLGSIDSNYYNTFTDAGLTLEVYDGTTGAFFQTSPFSLEGWRTFANHDVRTRRPAQQYQPYTVLNTVGSNLFSNPTFNTNISGVTLFGTSTTASYDNTSKISGVGSLRMDFSAPQANRYGLIHSPIGAVSSSKKYRVRFKTRGTTANGIVRVFFRKTASPYNDLIPVRIASSIGLGVKSQEVLIDGPTTDAGASVCIEVEQTSGTTYIDDVEVMEVNATINTFASQVRFEYNSTLNPRTITLDAKYISPDSTVYNGVITLQPFASAVMVKAGPIDSLPVANAGADKTIYLPVDSVILTGTATTMGAATVAWTKIAGPTQFTISSPGNATTKVSNLVVGTYRFELRVTDSRGFVSRDTVTVILANILPVKLTSFTGTYTGNKVVLNWVSQTEINSSHYVVEHSTDGRSFRALSEIASNDQADQESRYEYVDETPVNGVNYYRLKMVDRDGTKTYSRVITVQVDEASSLQPQAVTLNNGELNLQLFSSRAQVLSLVAVDPAGRVLIASQLQLQPGMNSIRRPVRTVATGICYLRLAVGEETVHRALIMR